MYSTSRVITRGKNVRYRLPQNSMKIFPVTVLSTEGKDERWKVFKNRYFRFLESYSLSSIWVEEGRIFLTRKGALHLRTQSN